MLDRLAALVRALDRFNELIGRGVAWMTLAMVAITFLVVVLRYAFALGWVWMQESYVWLHGCVFMLGAGYTLLHDGHVRVDIFYRPAGAAFKAWVDLFGSLVLLLPVVGLFFATGWSYVLVSWSRLEESREAGGMPGLFLLKTVIWGFCAVVALQGLALAGRSALTLAGRAPPGPGEEQLEGP